MYIKRKIENEILKYLGRPEIIALVGPRQFNVENATVNKNAVDFMRSHKIYRIFVSSFATSNNAFSFSI